MYGYYDGKNRKNQEQQEKVLYEDTEGFVHETEAESSESGTETAMANMFQLGVTKSLKRPQKAKQKKTPDPGEEERTRSKRLTDEAMMNIVCGDIATNTTATAPRGEALPPGPIMELPYMGS